jgi:hypothetical protein
MKKNLITLNRTEEQVKLIKLMASSNREEAMAAREAFAAAMSTAVLAVLQNAPTLSTLFRDLPYDENTVPSIPLDMYFDVTDHNYIPVWSQTVAGGLATSTTHALQEMMVATYPLNSAISFEQAHVKGSRLEIIAKGMERMAQEVLRKQTLNSAAVIFKALADARYSNAGTSTTQLLRTATTRQIVLDDFNRLLTLAARVNSSWSGGTPVGGANRVTDLYISPEGLERIRAMAYNPLNTVGSASNIPGTDSFRDGLFNGAGTPNIYGVNFHQLLEMGVGQLFNTIFDEYMGTTTFDGYGSGSAAAFNGAAEELILGLDTSRDSLLRPVLINSDSNSTWTVYPDDQFVARQKKVGFYGELREGRVAIDSRSFYGLVF